MDKREGRQGGAEDDEEWEDEDEVDDGWQDENGQKISILGRKGWDHPARVWHARSWPQSLLLLNCLYSVFGCVIILTIGRP
jgi:hypothetical protein